MGTPDTASRGPAGSPARPALATAGALVLAIALLQIAQQVIGVFSPRPSIQAALVVAVGLAALSAERLRSSRASGRDPVLLASAAGCLAALAVTAAIWAGAGFSTPAKPSVGTQVDEVRAALRRDGAAVTYRELALHQGATSHVFVVSPPAAPAGRGRARPSDELRVYDAAGGDLRLALAFRPEVSDPQTPRQALSASLHLGTVADFDGDGQQEVLASYDANRAGEEFQRVPVLLWREAASRRYAVTPLLAVRSLGPAASAGLPSYGFAPAGGRVAPSVWAGELALDAGRLFRPGHATLAASVVPQEADRYYLSVTVEPVTAGGRRAFGIPRTVRFYDLDLRGALPRARPLCPSGKRRAVVRLPARALGGPTFLGRPLARAMRDAGIRLGEFRDGRCLEAGS